MVLIQPSRKGFASTFAADMSIRFGPPDWGVLAITRRRDQFAKSDESIQPFGSVIAESTQSAETTCSPSHPT